MRLRPVFVRETSSLVQTRDQLGFVLRKRVLTPIAHSLRSSQLHRARENVRALAQNPLLLKEERRDDDRSVLLVSQSERQHVDLVEQRGYSDATP